MYIFISNIFFKYFITEFLLVQVVIDNCMNKAMFNQN